MAEKRYVNIFVSSLSDWEKLACQKVAIRNAALEVGGDLVEVKKYAEGFFGRSMTIEIPDGQGVNFTALVIESALPGFKVRSSCDGQIDVQLETMQPA